MKNIHQKFLFIPLLFCSSSLIIAQKAGISGISSTTHERLGIYTNRGGDFELIGPDGKDISSEDFRGKVVLIYFGYTFCPDICPTSLSQLKMVMLGLKKKAKYVQLLFITIDPERDNYEKLRDYVAYFYPTFIGLTGSVKEIEVVTKHYGSSFFKQYIESREGYLMAHTDAVFLVDQFGRYRGRYKTKWDMEELLGDVQWLLDN